MTMSWLLRELDPLVKSNVDRHLAAAKEWFPHEYVPWSRGRDFDGPLQGQPWEPAQSELPEVVRTALVMNLLTEDNLPSYHRDAANILTPGGSGDAWAEWVHRWTAEEGRHSIVIRDYLLTTRAVDPVALERARMAHVGTGFVIDYADSLLGSIAYVSFQELATRVSHRNTGRMSGDPVCERLLARVAADENLHMLFYRDVLAATLELVPDQAMRAICDVVKNFRMPGHGVENFARKSVQIAMAGIYDLRIHHDDVIMPVLRQLGVYTLDGLGGQGEAARDELATFLAGMDKSATRFEERRAAQRERAPQQHRIGRFPS